MIPAMGKNEHDQRRSLFFCFDGIDGSGKSTQISLFSAWLNELGYETTLCRDPGTTGVGEALRQVLLERNSIRIDRRCEMLVYMAARAQLVDEVIRPALAGGQIVVSDRFLTSNIVYQGHAGGLDKDSLRSIGEFATDNLAPDMTFLLDLDPGESTRRIGYRPADRMEAQGPEFFLQVREGFRLEARRDPQRHRLVDASLPIERVQQQIRMEATGLLPEAPPGSPHGGPTA